MNSNDFSVVGKSVPRVDITDKASGRTKYTNDLSSPGMLHAKLHISNRAHAMIHSIDLTKAWEVSGVRAILTGESFPFPVGPLLADRPPLAVKKVRYFGEPIALVVADTEQQARKAALLIEVMYKDLPVVNSPSEALNGDCGSCTVLVDGIPINACHILSVEAIESRIMTIEGLKDQSIPEEFIKNWAIQCGYCTPGFILNSYALIQNNPDANDALIDEWLESNICRCTGYQEIKESVKTILDRMKD